jgi:hypothetical protein
MLSPIDPRSNLLSSAVDSRSILHAVASISDFRAIPAPNRKSRRSLAILQHRNISLSYPLCEEERRNRDEEERMN